MPTKALIALLVLSNGILLATTVLFASLWVAARERAIRALLNKTRDATARSEDIEHLVTAVDSIAVEVERISEAQRFTAKVLVDRNEAASPAQPAKRIPERVITPH